MMIIAAMVIIGLTLLLCAERVYGNAINPVTFYVMPWTTCTLFACSGLYGIYRPGDVSLALISMGMASFGITCVLVRCFANSKRDKESFVRRGGVSVGTAIPSHKTFVILNIIALTMSSLYATRTVPYLLDGHGLSYLRYQYSNVQGANLFTVRELLLYQWLVLPVTTASMVSAASSLAREKPDGWAFLFSIAGVLLYTLVSGGRSAEFELIVLVSIGILFSQKRGDILVRLRTIPRYVRVILITIGCSIAYITVSRSLRFDASVAENVFFYSAGAVTYFDNLVSNPWAFGLADDLLFGRATFGFLWNPILIVLSVVFGFRYLGSDAIITSATSAYLRLSDRISGNAMFTCLYPFMRDFGNIGVVIGPMIFGLFLSLSWECSHGDSENRAIWLAVCIYLLYVTIFSVWRYSLLFPSSGMTLLLIALFNWKPHELSEADDSRSPITINSRYVA